MTTLTIVACPDCPVQWGVDVEDPDTSGLIDHLTRVHGYSEPAAHAIAQRKDTPASE